MHSTEILLNTATITEVNSTAIDFFLCLKLCGERNTGLVAITAPSNKEPNKLSQFQNTQLNLLNSDFACHLKVNRDKLALINRQWKCRKGKS